MSSCTLTSCYGRSRTWVPRPPTVFPKRVAIMDAHTLTEDPCHPPGRCFPCSKPVPKFRLIRKFGGCDPCTMAQIEQEKKAAKKEECAEQWRQYYQSLTPKPIMEIGLNPNQPVEFQMEAQPNGRCKEMKYKTDLTAGFFNKDDNKTYEEANRERCDPAWCTCNPTLPPYPCRGVINHPRLRWVTRDEEARLCFPVVCKTQQCSYLTPEHLYKCQQRNEQWAEEDRLKQCQQLEEQTVQDDYCR